MLVYQRVVYQSVDPIEGPGFIPGCDFVDPEIPAEHPWPSCATAA